MTNDWGRDKTPEEREAEEKAAIADAAAYRMGLKFLPEWQIQAIEEYVRRGGVVKSKIAEAALLNRGWRKKDKT